MKGHIITMVVLALVACGCASSTITRQPAKTKIEKKIDTTKTEIGKPIDIKKYNQIIEGKTTEAEVVALLGDPSQVVERDDGKMLKYSHLQTPHSGRSASPAGTKGESSHKMLMFKINSKGVVVWKSR